MKNYLRVLGVLFSLSILMTSCSEGGDDNNNNEGDGYEAAFSSQFPNATNVAWTSKDGYYIADFMDVAFDNTVAVTSTVRSSSSVEKQAWYDEDGKCYLEEDFISINDVPSVVKEDFESWYGDNGGTTTLVSATKGRYKSSVFYKLYCTVTTNMSSYTILGTYYYSSDSDFEMMDYDEDVDTAEIITTLPDLYAMQYIEQTYSDYCLGVEAKTYSDDDALEEYGADEFIYIVLLYLPLGQTAMDLIFIDGSSVGAVEEEFEWGGNDDVIIEEL